MVMLPEVTVDDTLRKLAVFNELTTFGISAEDIERLRATAPAWPTEPGRVRTLRIRKEPVGVGFNAARNTFDAHVAMARATLGEALRISYDPKAMSVDYFPFYGRQLPRNTACEWIIVDLAANANTSIEKLGLTSDDIQRRWCADELLALAWLAPEVLTQLAEHISPTLYKSNVAWRMPCYETSSDCSWGPAWSSLALCFKKRRETTRTDATEAQRKENAFHGFVLLEGDCAWEHVFIPEIVP